jgi:hypothetical protein
MDNTILWCRSSYTTHQGSPASVWLHSKIQSLEASHLQSTDFGAFIGSPVMAEKEQRHHACEMRNCKTRSCQGFM